jgi:hypothetical protein
MRTFLIGSLCLISLAACSDEPTSPGQPTAAIISPRGEIKVVLHMRPEVVADVPFTVTGKQLTRFVLDDDDNATRPNVRRFPNLGPGTYTVTQAAVPDGPLTDILCVSSVTDNNTIDLTSRTLTVVLEPGESVVCTFVDGWEAGDLFTFPQSQWGEDLVATEVLFGHFSAVYPSGTLEMGIPGVDGFSNIFTDPAVIVAYLPRLGTGIAGPLTADQIDPLSDASGDFGGEALALRLNVDFSDAGVLTGSDIALGDLKVCRLDLSDLQALHGKSVREVLALMHMMLGAPSQTFPYIAVELLALEINDAFLPFVPLPRDRDAQQHLFVGECP